MKIEIIVDNKNEMPEKLLLEAENEEEQKILTFMHHMNKEGGLIPTLDKLVDMINNGLLIRAGDKWVLRADIILYHEMDSMMYR